MLPRGALTSIVLRHYVYSRIRVGKVDNSDIPCQIGRERFLGTFIEYISTLYLKLTIHVFGGPRESVAQMFFDYIPVY